jgi:hypothetical protein
LDAPALGEHVEGVAGRESLGGGFLAHGGGEGAEGEEGGWEEGGELHGGEVGLEDAVEREEVRKVGSRHEIVSVTGDYIASSRFGRLAVQELSS